MFKFERTALLFDSEVKALLEEVYSALERKEFFAIEGYEPIGEGYVYKAYDNAAGELASIFVLLYPGLSEENLGYDIELSKQELTSVAIADVAATRTNFRGYHLQRTLMQMGEIDAIKDGYKYLMCTIHPENLASLNNALALGYEVVKTKAKYGGMLRHILKKNLF